MFNVSINYYGFSRYIFMNSDIVYLQQAKDKNCLCFCLILFQFSSNKITVRKKCEIVKPKGFNIMF